ncbi:class I SAM-dependent DNA methyltransferase [Micromonospora sp. NBC_01813]|uniref:class I SAM-dependent DNA methyltransferase n=1 Tax=Micromonospora sp. NBC_01813 TaxID=2975988 RepID=UPI002DDBEDF9|nr:class I SAM-dependent DNA methyltransferase [Micromonospora sp. NBC_01813]WSA06951.1 class I SAM-dependent DNA methyltransferase [Micromonospora sp. NBC_01813]
MSSVFDSIINRGEYLSAHYFADQLGTELKKRLLATWAIREGDEYDNRATPRQMVRALRREYLTPNVRGYLAAGPQADPYDLFDLGTYNDPEWRKSLVEWHQNVLRALGYEPAPTELTVHRAGREHAVPVAYHGPGIVALDCGWAADGDAAFDPAGAGRLLSPVRVNASERYETGAALASWLFHANIGRPDCPPPRFILLLHGGVIVLADRNSWAEGRYLAANLDAALERNDRAQSGELATLAALFCREMLCPGENDTAPAMDALLKGSTVNAVGVSKELRHGVQRAVEIIAGEVLRRMAEPVNDVTPADIEEPRLPFARELTRDCLRYLYRILFLLYAEARPELGILPADDGNYEAGYSVARLRELVARDEELMEEEARNSFHLYHSLDLLFNKVNLGHRRYGTEPDDDQPGDDEQTRQEKAERRSEDIGLRFDPLRSELFDPDSIRLIGQRALDPRCDEETAPRWLDLRLRNSALHRVLRLLTMKKARPGTLGGFVSYRNLGINELGAVYEGLMSYTGIIAGEELCEVARGGDPDEGSWLIPARRQNDYPDDTLVHYDEEDARHGLRGVKKYERGSFVYRLSGRERETSASYYTPESLTTVTVELALKELLGQGADSDADQTRAARLLSYKICEPALGSGAFLNEAINQLAEEYLRRRQKELDRSIPAGDVLTEKQKVKAYIALHNAYGVDLNATGRELAEVSLWLNTMHPGMQAPWFGLHLRRGNSLIGARRAIYSAHDVCSPEKAWLKAKGSLPPTPLPLHRDGRPQPLPDDAVHQFLLPSPGWAAITHSTEAKKLAKDEVDRLAAWRRGLLQRPARSTAHLNADGTPKIDRRTGKPRQEAASQFTRLRDAARRAEFLWSCVVKRMELSEREIARRIDVWGADPADPEYAFLRRPEQAVPKEKVYAELFEAAGTPYRRLKTVMDAWCALWFWPTDRIGLLDGTHPEYAAAVAEIGVEALTQLLGGIVDAEVPVDPAPTGEDSGQPPAAADEQPQAPEPVFFRAMTLFPVAGEQMALDETEWETAAATPVATSEPKPKKAPKPKQPARRPTIPLTSVDDWLDFLEAMLGAADVPDGTLIDKYDDLDQMKEFEENLVLFMGMDNADPEARFPWLRTVRELADRHAFLHWELDFALVFAENGGFDLQVGNPPWVRPRWNEDAVLAEFEPWFELEEKPDQEEKDRRRHELLERAEVRGYVLRELTATSGQVAFFGSTQVYPLLVGTQPDLYRAFMCQVWAHQSAGGTVGLLHPDSHFTGDKEGPLRGEAYRRLRIHGDFVNAGQRFFPEPVGHTAHFGVHIYSRPREIRFDHLSWLVSTDALRHSRDHDGSGDVPGVRYKNREFDERPHRSRVVIVTEDVLAVWRRLLDEEDRPLSQARLLFPVSTAEAAAIEALAAYPLRLAELLPQISSGYHESGSKRARLIEYNRVDRATGRQYQPATWGEVVLKGIQVSTATPIFKRHDANSNDPYGVDLISLPSDFVPDTEYLCVPGRDAAFREAQDRWVDHEELRRLRTDAVEVTRARARLASTLGMPEVEVEDEQVDALLVEQARRPYVDFYRLAWRRQVAPNTERALYSALIPPGPTHIHAVHSMVMPSIHQTVLVAGFWTSLPLDYFLRATGRGDLQVAGAKVLPAPSVAHPLASALLLRTLRLNCLTSVYAGLWAELFDPAWLDGETWVFEWPGLPPLNDVTPNWRPETPLRTERARRSTLVEIDALVAVWLGMSADALVAAYRGRFPVLQKYEAVTWFDADGWKLAGNARTFGQRQTKQTWAQFEAYWKDPENTPPPDGYTPPFYKAEREAEMRAAHAVFQARLDAAVARGEWDHGTAEVNAS